MTRATSKPRGGSWRGDASDGQYGLATIEPAFAEPYFEGMETRLLLAAATISDADFARIQTLYPDLGLTALSTYKTYNITTLTQANLQADIDNAGTTKSLIVVRTATGAASQNTITLSSQLSIAANANITIVSLSPVGSTPVQLTIDAKQNSRVLYINGSSSNRPTVSLAGLTLTGGRPTTGSGGGIYNSYGTLTITNSTITGNTVTGSNDGGGIENYYGTLTIINSTITKNTASGGNGGGIENYYGTLRMVTGSVIAENTALRGGGIYTNSGSPTITNSTITRNTATNTSNPGGGIYHSGDTMTLSNSIVVNNGSADIYGGSSILGYHNLSGSTTWRTSGSVGNLAYYPGQPLFVNAAAGDYHLAPNSQAIDKGNNGRAQDIGLRPDSSRDMDGNLRFNRTIDIGAYESEHAVPTISVSPAEFDKIKAMYPGLNLAAYADYNIIEVTAANLSADMLRAAITLASTTTQNDLIVVRTNATQHTIELSSQLLFDFNASACGTITLVSFGDKPLTLDAKQNSRVVNISNTNANVSLAGLTITNGYLMSGSGAGIYNYGTLTVANSRIEWNVVHGSGDGGGIENYFGTLTVMDSIIRHNTANGTGGGIDNYYGTLRMVANTLIAENTANRGGGIYTNSGSPTVVNSTIARNTATNTSNPGGGIYHSGSALTLANTIVVGNGSLDIYRGGTINGYNNLTPYANTDTTIWSGTRIGNIQYNGNIQSLFVGAAAGDYRLQQNSQAVDKGDYDQAYAADLTKNLRRDLEGVPRILGAEIDIGAYEYSVIPTAPASVTVTHTAARNVTLSWTRSTDADGYRVEWYEGSTLRGSKDVTGGNTLSTIVNDLLPGTVYTFRVYATTSIVSGTTSGIRISANYTSASTTTPVEATPPAPNAPASISTPTSVTQTSLTLSWTSSASTSKYLVQWYTASNNSFVDSMEVTTTSANITGLLAGTTYLFRVYSIGNGTATAGQSVGYASRAVTTTAAPALVPDLVASNGGTGPTSVVKGNTISVTSGTIQNNGTAASGSYTVTFYASTSASNIASGIPLGSVSMTSLAAGASTTATLNNASTAALNAGTSYYIGWVITGVSGETVVSNNTAYRTTTMSVTAPAAAPAAPGNFHSSSQTSNSVTLSWTAQSGLTGYTLQYRKSTDEGWTTHTAPGTGDSSATVPGLSANTLYYFRLTATNAGGSAVSTASVTTLAAPVLPAPAAPGSVTISNPTQTGFRVSWAASTGAGSYKVEWWNASTNTLVNSWTGTGTSHDVTGLTAGTTYLVRVYAIGNGTTHAGQSPDHASVVAPTLAVPVLPAPDAPASVTVSNVTQTGASLSWAAVSGAGSYKVEWWNASTNTLVNSWTGSGTSYNVPSLTADTTYLFKVYAVGNGTATTGQSVGHVSAAATTLAVPVVPAPEAPASLTVSNVATTSVRLTWAASTGASGYEIEWYVGGTLRGSRTITSGSTLTADITGLDSETTYLFRVYATGNGKTSNGHASAAVATLAATVLPAPEAPVSVTVSNIGTTGVTLTWASSGGADGYRVEWYNGSTLVNSWTGTGTTYTVPSLSADTTYLFKVYATGNSKTSVTYASTAATTAAVPVLPAPAAPGSVTVSNLTQTGFRVSWTASTGAGSYKVEWWNASTNTLVNSWTGTGTSHDVTGLSENTVYMLRVYAIGNETTHAGQSTDHASRALTTLSAAVLPAPEAPASLTVSSAGTQSVNVTWAASTGASGYLVQWYSGSTLVDSRTVSGTSTEIAGLSAETTYLIRVYATGNGTTHTGQSATYASVAATTTAVVGQPAPVAPASVSVSNIGTAGVTLTWTAGTNASEYRVEWWNGSTLVNHKTVTGGNTLTTDITGLSAETTYLFRVYAIGNAQTSASYASIAAATAAVPVQPTLPAPVAPTSVVASNVELNKATLTWTASAGAGGYRVEWYDASGGLVDTRTITGGNVLTTEITGLAEGGTYLFRVYATGNGTATVGQSVTYASAAATTPRPVSDDPDPTVIDWRPDAAVKAPTKLAATATNIGAQSVTLTWAVSTDAAANGYIVEWYIKGLRVGKVVLTGRNVTSATIDGLVPGTAYSFQVYTTTSDERISSKPAAKAVTTKALPAPASVKAKADGIAAVTLTWAAPKQATVPSDMKITGYKIYDLSGNLIGSVAANATTFRVDTLTSGATLKPTTAYSFRVVAVYEPKAGGVSVETAKPVTVKATTAKFLAPKLAAKSATLASDLTSTSITLRWLANSDADGFFVTCLQKTTPITLNFGTGGNATYLTDGLGKIVGVTITGLNPGMKYDFSIQATNSTLNATSAILKKSVTTLK